MGLEACKRRLRGVATAQLVTREDTADKAKAGDVGKTATGRLPCSLLDVYVQLQADMQQKLMPDVEWLHTDLFTGKGTALPASVMGTTRELRIPIPPFPSGSPQLYLLIVLFTLMRADAASQPKICLLLLAS